MRALPVFLIALILTGPVTLGLLATLLPALGYLPVIGAAEFTLEPLSAVFSAPGIWTSLRLSFGIGLTATFLSLVLVALFTAGWHGTRLFRQIQRLLSPLLAIPHAAAAFGLAFLIAPSGFIARALSPWATGSSRPLDLLIIHDPMGLAMCAGLIAKEMPFLFLVTLAALPQVNSRDQSLAAETLGYGKVAAWMTVVFPAIYTRIRLPVLAVLAYSTSVVDVALILGPTTPPPLSPRIMHWMADPEPAMRLQAAAAALVQLFVSLAAIAVWLLGERFCRRLAGVLAFSGRRVARERALRGAGVAVTLVAVALVFAGLALHGLWSLAGRWRFPDSVPTALTSRHWQVPFSDGGNVVLTTLALALPAAAIAGFLTIGALEGRTRSNRQGQTRARFLLFIPLIAPQITFLFGLHMLFIATGIDASYPAVLLAHLTFALPYVFLALADPWNGLDPHYGHVAASLGASDRKIFWKIRLPLLLRPILTAAAIGFAVSVGLYLPTLIIGGGRFATVTTESLALASGGSRQVIAVYAMLQMLLPLIAFALAAAVPALLYKNRTALKTTQ